MNEFRIDLSGDTKTRPSLGMRNAIAQAIVGDEQFREDPTVAELIHRCTSLLGHQDGIFVPSGTMANLIAILVHCTPGDEVAAHASAHIFDLEAGGLSAIAGAMPRRLQGDRGTFSPQTLFDLLDGRSEYSPHGSKVRLAVIEQTSNFGGGTIWSLPTIEEIVLGARTRGVKLHMDGARLMNAAVATGITPSQYSSGFDSVYFDFTKCLGAPVGSILVGSKEFIDKAWVWKKRLGGSMRQAGVLAAACIYALDNNIEQIKVDHANARSFADALTSIPMIAVERVDTNIVFFNIEDTGINAAELSARLRPQGIRFLVAGPRRLRAVTHLDVSNEDVREAASAIREIMLSSSK